jgi:hypothetical protein
MGKFLAFLLLVGVGIGVVKIFEDYKARQKAERNLWPERLAGPLRLHTAQSILNGESRGGQSSFLQLLYMTYQVEQDGYPLLDTLMRGASLAGAGAPEAPLIAAALLDNMQRARNLGAFQNPANLITMERGNPPLATAPGWEDERLTLGYKISPLLGAELKTSLPNMVLMPESIRNMQTDLTPPEAQALAAQWLGARIISPETANAIRNKIEADSNLR